MIRLIFSFFIVFFVSGCATAPKSKPDLKEKSDKIFNELGKEEKSGKKQIIEEAFPEEKKTDENNADQNGKNDGTMNFEETGEGSASKYERTIDAEKRAEEDALSKALKKTGVNIYYGFSDLIAQYGKSEYQFVARYMYMWTSAMAVWEKAGKPEVTTLDSGGVKCSLRIKGKIYLKGNPDPSYEIRFDLKDKNLGLDKQVYFNGDEVKLDFWATKDSYVTILNIDEDKNVYMVYPNKNIKSSLIEAGKIFKMPENSSFSVKAMLPEGKDESLELIHVIVSKKSPVFTMEESSEVMMDNNRLFKVGEFNKVIERLSKLDRNEWTMVILPFTIKRR